MRSGESVRPTEFIPGLQGGGPAPANGRPLTLRGQLKPAPPADTGPSGWRQQLRPAAGDGSPGTGRAVSSIQAFETGRAGDGEPAPPAAASETIPASATGDDAAEPASATPLAPGAEAAGQPASDPALAGDQADTHQVNGHPVGPHPDGHAASSPAPGSSGRHRGSGERAATYREVFANREFRALWSAQVLSYAGDQFAQVAIAILVYDRTRSPLLTAVAYALTYLPPILGGPLLSGLADVFPRRRVMIVLDLLRAALVAGMVVPAVPFGGLCALVFLVVLLGPPFSAARTALLPDVLPPGQFVLASSIGNITFQASQIAGFVGGAAVVAVIGPHRALAVDALSFCLSAAIVAGWVRRRPAPAQWPTPRRSLVVLTRDGAAYVFGRPVLRTLVLLGWLAGFAVVPEGLAAPYAHALGGGPLTVGLLMAAMPTGMIIGALLIGRLVRPATRIRLVGWMAMLSCAPLMVSLAQPPLWALLALWMLAGAGGAYQLTAAAEFVHALPAAIRGRAFGIAQSGLLAAQGLGILAAGAAAQWLGPQTVVATAGLLGMTMAAILASAWSCQHAELMADEAASPSPGPHPAVAVAAAGNPAPLTPEVPAPRVPAPDAAAGEAPPPGRAAS